eukprot:COSAG02_NODE_52959_length_304_cov_3.185366_1_plen_47_part_01
MMWMMCGSESLDARQQVCRARASKATNAGIAAAAAILHPENTRLSYG